MNQIRWWNSSACTSLTEVQVQEGALPSQGRSSREPSLRPSNHGDHCLGAVQVKWRHRHGNTVTELLFR